MELKGLSKKDMLRFKNLANEREKVIKTEKNLKLDLSYKTNEVAKSLHPTVQYVKVDNIIKENENVKTFVLAPDESLGTTKLAYFQAGQYVSLKVKIGTGIYRRPYSISCSPKYTLKENKYTITVKRVKDGIVSNYLFDKVEIGDQLEISGPAGNFYYQPLRDSQNIIAIAGGSGITPIFSIAQAIFDGIIDANMVILYGNKTKNDIIFSEQLDDMVCKTNKIKVVNVLSEDDAPEYEKGFITKDLIDKYLSEENSFFVCGPKEMYQYINEILKEYAIPKKFVRHDLFMSDIETKSDEEYNLLVMYNDMEVNIKCYGDKTLLSAMEEAGIPALSRCHVGECGFCRSKLISGKVKTFDTHLRSADRRFSYIHPCSTYPESDVVIKLPF